MSLNLIAYQRIKAMIVAGEIPLGAKLRETRLVPLLNMSRTPIREALLQLHAEGMLEGNDEGLFVKKYTHEQILEVYHCRAILESEAIKLIAKKGLPLEVERVIYSVLDACENILQRLDKLESPHDLQLPIKNEFLVQNNIFHDTLYNACPNSQLLTLLGRTEKLPEAIRNYTSFTPKQLLASHLGHKQIVRAIKMRDAERASALMKEHIWASRDRMKPETYETMRQTLSLETSDLNF
jgi:GntR family transcriptional regulator, vanillate catabolism transcriptional regulator